MKRLAFAVLSLAGLFSEGTMAASELDLEDRPAMMHLADDLLRCVITFRQRS
jgi:hypothetical protein